MENHQYSTPRLSDFSPRKQLLRLGVRLYDPRSDDAGLNSLERLQSLLIKESTVEKSLEGIEVTAKGYRMKQKKLKDKIFLYRAVLAPVRKLSIEVLIIIFRFLLETSPDDIRHLGLVCTQWRNATLAPRLWSNIVVSRECHALEQKAMLFSERSLPHLIKVSYSQSLHAGCKWKVWDKLLSIASRWSTVALTFDDCKSAFERVPRLGSSPHLQELSITIRRQSTSFRDEGRFGLDLHDMEKTPSLRSLIISTHILPGKISWFTKLTNLHINDTFGSLVQPRNNPEPMHGNHVLDILRSCSSINEFSFEAENSSKWFSLKKYTMDVRGSPVVLQHLRRLRLTCHYTVGYCLLMNIAPPEGLEDLALRLLPRFDSLPKLKLEETAGKFIISCRRIHSLSLYGVNHRVVVAGLRYGLQELQDLHLKHISEFGVSELEEIAGCLFQDPTRPEKQTWCAVRLSKVIIEANWRDVPFQRLAMAIKARYIASLGNDQPSRIHGFVINDQNLLDGESPGDVVIYKRPRRFAQELSG